VQSPAELVFPLKHGDVDTLGNQSFYESAAKKT
jgi:hypothetical protein